VKTVTNKTRRPLSVPFPRGGVLHLGPGRTGQITPEAAEKPALRKLVEAGELELADDGVAAAGGGGGGRKGPPAFHGHAAGGAGRRGGDR
jgi:hypothetical protein